MVRVTYGAAEVTGQPRRHASLVLAFALIAAALVACVGIITYAKSTNALAPVETFQMTKLGTEYMVSRRLGERRGESWVAGSAARGVPHGPAFTGGQAAGPVVGGGARSLGKTVAASRQEPLCAAAAAGARASHAPARRGGGGRPSRIDGSSCTAANAVGCLGAVRAETCSAPLRAHQ